MLRTGRSAAIACHPSAVTSCPHCDAPLKPAPDAHILDTTALDADGAFDVALTMVAGAVRGGAARKAQP